MRILFFLILIANLLFFAANMGLFGQVIPDGREPQRLSQQYNVDAATIVATDQAPSAPLSPPKSTACVEFGGFAGDDAHKVETQFDQLGIAQHPSARHADEQASFIVYLPPFKSKQDADHAAAELHRIGVNDFFVIQDNGPFKLAISLGIFHTEDAAKAQLTALNQLGVKNARTGERVTTVSKTYYQFRNVDPEAMARLAELKEQYPNEDLHDCAVNGSSTPTSTSGASSTGSAAPAVSAKGI